MDEKFYVKLLSLARIWWFGPLSGAVIAIGFANILGICLTFLYYLTNLEKVSLNLILVLFSVAMLLFANTILMIAGLKRNKQLLIPWLAITSIALIGAIIYCALLWDDITQFKAPLVAVMILTIYFMAVVSSFYHELVAPEEIIKQKEKAAVTFHDEDATVGIQIEEQTVLVSLEPEQDNPPSVSLPSHPCPDEVISLPATNPFVNDIFSEGAKPEDNSKEMQTKKKPSADMNLKANFTPFKKNSKVEGKTPAKMKVFLPGDGGDESDFDFSFTDPDFDSSLCAVSHPVVEDQ